MEGLAAVDGTVATVATVEGMDATVEEMNATMEAKPRVLSPLDRIELPTGACPGRVLARGWKGTRQRIVVGPAEGASYHIMSRTAGGERLLGDTEKEALRRLMWRMARFAGVKIHTYAVMDNHFHILARVPAHNSFVEKFVGPGGEARLLEHLRLLYSRAYIAALRAELADLRQHGMPEEAEALIAGYLRRMCNLPVFVKELKERFSRWYNMHRSRRGTLWMERFKSVLVEDGEALRTMAAYIDLNPLRAGMVKDPKDYRWSGYGEAMGGGTAARSGLCGVVGHADRGAADWDTPATAKGMSAAEVYRCWLFEDGKTRSGKTTKGGTRGGFSAESAEAENKRMGKLSRAALLRCRVRYFSDGLVLGTKSYVDGVFVAYRGHFGPKRTSGARALREDAQGSLFTARQLSVRTVG
jgi:REP element-mobilizing transposase RayT